MCPVQSCQRSMIVHYFTLLLLHCKVIYISKLHVHVPIQGWIQTSATSFQKLVRIVKKLKK